MLFADISPEGWVAIITAIGAGVVAIIGALTTAFLTLRNDARSDARDRLRDEKDARAAADIRTELVTQAAAIKAAAETHALQVKADLTEKVNGLAAKITETHA